MKFVKGSVCVCVCVCVCISKELRTLKLWEEEEMHQNLFNFEVMEGIYFHFYIFPIFSKFSTVSLSFFSNEKRV